MTLRPAPPAGRGQEGDQGEDSCLPEVTFPAGTQHPALFQLWMLPQAIFHLIWHPEQESLVPAGPAGNLKLREVDDLPTATQNCPGLLMVGAGQLSTLGLLPMPELFSLPPSHPGLPVGVLLTPWLSEGRCLACLVHDVPNALHRCTQVRLEGDEEGAEMTPSLQTKPETLTWGPGPGHSGALAGLPFATCPD